jgi:glutathione S-transferase
MLTLYTAPGTCALATHIALEEAGATFELAKVDFPSQAQRSPAYLAVNPKGRVPALVTDQGILTETPALLLYVAQLYPAAKLAPLDDPFLLARMQAFNSYLCATVHINHAHGRRGARWADQASSHADMLAKVPQTMAECTALIEREMLAGPWVLGAQYSVADGYLYTIARWLKGDGVDVADYPNLAAHLAAMEARPAVQRMLAAY